MTTQSRQRWTAEEKLRVVEEARHTPQTVSEVCRHYGIAPGQFYAWEKRARQREVELEAEVTRLHAVVAELSSENLQLKKGRWL